MSYFYHLLGACSGILLCFKYYQCCIQALPKSLNIIKITSLLCCVFRLFLIFCRKVLKSQSFFFFFFFYRWRMHKWQSCILVPESVQRGLSGQGEACGNGLETRGKSELSWLAHFLHCACQLPLHHQVQVVLLHPATLSLMRLNSPFRSAPPTSKWWKPARWRQFV